VFSYLVIIKSMTHTHDLLVIIKSMTGGNKQLSGGPHTSGHRCRRPRPAPVTDVSFQVTSVSGTGFVLLVITIVSLVLSPLSSFRTFSGVPRSTGVSC
jgi:hypothetical protein